MLAIPDRFTERVKNVPLKEVSTEQVAKHFVDPCVVHYGPSIPLIADDGNQFTSPFVLDVCHILSIQNAFKITDKPQANGIIERFNRTILASSRNYILETRLDWDIYTPELTYAYNAQLRTNTSIQ